MKVKQSLVAAIEYPVVVYLVPLCSNVDALHAIEGERALVPARVRDSWPWRAADFNKILSSLFRVFFERASVLVQY